MDHECFICKQRKIDAKDYRNNVDIEIPLIIEYPQTRELNANDVSTSVLIIYQE